MRGPNCEICGEEVAKYCTCVRCLDCGHLFSEEESWKLLGQDDYGCVVCGETKGGNR